MNPRYRQSLNLAQNLTPQGLRVFKSRLVIRQLPGCRAAFTQRNDEPLRIVGPPLGEWNLSEDDRCRHICREGVGRHLLDEAEQSVEYLVDEGGYRLPCYLRFGHCDGVSIRGVLCVV